MYKETFKYSKVKNIEFSSNSKLELIEKEALGSEMESLTIHQNLIELDEGWCINLKNILKIDVHPKNKRFSVYDGKFIIGKSKIEQENYDVLVFCVRNVEKVIIPSFIEIIESHSFENCSKLQLCEFQPNSKLKKNLLLCVS